MAAAVLAADVTVCGDLDSLVAAVVLDEYVENECDWDRDGEPLPLDERIDNGDGDDVVTAVDPDAIVTDADSLVRGRTLLTDGKVSNVIVGP